jgi:hypothetical protein
MKTMLPLLPPGPGGFTKSPLPGPNHKQVTLRSLELMNGGESGIRTHGRSPYTRVPGEHNRPLCHLSTRHSLTGYFVRLRLRRPWTTQTPAEEEGFEPPVGCPTPDFESGTIGLSDTPPPGLVAASDLLEEALEERETFSGP